MVTLYGAYTHNFDTKGRLSLPAKFRKKLPTDLIASVDLEGQCLYVFDEEGFESYVELFFERQGGYDPSNAEHIEARRQLSEKAVDISTDSSGRINVPASLREAVGLGKEVELIGNKGYFEIWDAKRREEARATVDLRSFVKHS